MGYGLLHAALLNQRNAKVGVGFGLVGVVLKGAVEAVDGVIHPARLQQRVAEVCARACEVRLEHEGPLVVGNGLIQVAGLQQRVAEVRMDEDVVRLDLQRPSILHDGLVHPAPPAQRVAKAAVGRGIAGLQLQGHLDVRHGLVDAPLLKQPGGKIVVGHPARGVPSDRRPPEDFRIGVDRALPPAQHAQQGGDAKGRDPSGHAGGRREEPCAQRERGRRRRQHDRGRKVLEMVGDKGVDKGEDIHEPQGWKERARKQEGGGQRPAMAASKCPQRSQDACGCGREQVLPKVAGVDRPPRIDEGQANGPNDLAEIEPKGPPRHKEAARKSEVICGSARADKCPLHPRRHGAGPGPQREQRHQRQDVAPPRKPPPLPPKDDEERRREGCGHALGQDGQHEESRAQGIPPEPAHTVISQIRKSSGQVKDSGQRVLLLRDPSDRLHADRMEGEDRSGEERAGDRKAPQDAKEQERRPRMQRDIEQVIPERRIAPDAVLQPEGAPRHRVVLLRRAGLEPDPPKAVERAQAGARDVGVIIPDETGAKHGLVRDQRRDRQRKAGQPIALPPRLPRPRKARGRPAGVAGRPCRGLRPMELLLWPSAHPALVDHAPAHFSTQLCPNSAGSRLGPEAALPAKPALRTQAMRRLRPVAAGPSYLLGVMPGTVIFVESPDVGAGAAPGDPAAGRSALIATITSSVMSSLGSE